MSVVINTNSAATSASNNLAASNAMLQRSLNRLSSGSKIVQPSDDAGGLAVSMKLTATINRTDAVNTNIQNAMSFLQTQDGALQTATKIIDRMSELKVLAMDVTKNGTDVDNYETEFEQLQDQLDSLKSETFNSVSLFGAASLDVATTESGGASAVSLERPDLDAVFGTIAAVDFSTDNLNDDTDVSVEAFTDALQTIATYRAQNGATASRLSFASEMLTVNKQNLEAANSRIIDVDVASESTQLAKYNVLVQAGSSMLGQANASSQVALKLLG